jgi:hypothetical protein
MPAQGLVQAVSGAANMLAQGMSCYVTNSAAPHQLSDIIIAIVVQGPMVSGSGFASISSVIDIANGPYTSLTSLAAGMTGLRHSVWYRQNISNAPQNSNQIIANFSAASTNIYIRFVEFSGVTIGGNPIDVAASSMGHATSPVAGPITTIVTNDLLFSCASVDAPLGGAGSGWTLANLDAQGAVDQFILNAPIEIAEGTFTELTTANYWVTSIMGLVNAGAGIDQLGTVNINTQGTLVPRSQVGYGGLQVLGGQIGMNLNPNILHNATVVI